MNHKIDGVVKALNRNAFFVAWFGISMALMQKRLPGFICLGFILVVILIDLSYLIYMIGKSKRK